MQSQITIEDYPTEPLLIENLKAEFMRNAIFVPIDLNGDELTVAMAEPDNFHTLDTLRIILGHEVHSVQGREADILEVVERLYGSVSQSLEMIIEEADKDAINGYDATTPDKDIEHLKDMASEAPIIRLVNRVILDALEARASDIHFEPYEHELKVRYRIDGILCDIESPPERLKAAIVSRIKIMAQLDIAERRLPQDGRVKLKIAGRLIDFRVSTLPTLFGESIVLRILDRGSLAYELQQLGMSTRVMTAFTPLIRQPHGMLLVTGPTGSGKTSTLYTTLSKINSPENKIITLEDPVEYQLKGINQIHINTKIGLTFANGLRSVVRQDPDIILVGEIRDLETAEIAVRSAMTGHLLFSTLHTNDAASAVTRMLDMGVKNYLLNSTLLGVLAQRLIRVNCEHCRTPRPLEPNADVDTASFLNQMGLDTYYYGSGCNHCRSTGFFGRTAIFELLTVDGEIRQAIINQMPTDKLRELAIEKGMAPLRQDGWEKVRDGVTVPAEVIRVTYDV